MNSGIYIIRNAMNGKVYVGSSNQITERWKHHRSQLNIRKHANRHLQGAWNSYGRNTFEFIVMEECAPAMLIIREQAWIDYYDAANPEKGYNLSKNAEVSTETQWKKGHTPWNKGKHGIYDDKTLERIRVGSIGNKAHLGKKHSKDTRKKMSASHIGNTAHLGKKHSETAKEKMRQKALGNKHRLGTGRKRER
jgi:group I intron endonuclease